VQSDLNPLTPEANMNWTQIEGRWEQLKGDARAKWGKLTDDDLMVVRGRADQLIGKIVTRYGIKREQAQQQVDEWAARLRDSLAHMPGRQDGGMPASPRSSEPPSSDDEEVSSSAQTPRRVS
jgi:uncharacterized protein YjbJ (UPF0337 family)